MKIKLKETFDYIPKWQGNRNSPVEEQIVVTFKFLSGLDLEYLIADGNVGGDAEFAYWKKMCVNIKNLDFNGKPAKVEDIIQYGGFQSLWRECKKAYADESFLDEEIKKK